MISGRAGAGVGGRKSRGGGGGDVKAGDSEERKRARFVVCSNVLLSVCCSLADLYSFQARQTQMLFALSMTKEPFSERIRAKVTHVAEVDSRR